MIPMQTDRSSSSARNRCRQIECPRRVRGRLATLASTALASVCLAANAPSQRATPDPAHYVRRATWQQTMLASLEALTQQGLADGFATFESDTVRGGQPAQRVSVNVAGAAEMYLFVTGIPNVKWAVADWADAVLVGKEGGSTPLSELKNLAALHGRLEKDLTLRSGL